MAETSEHLISIAFQVNLGALLLLESILFINGLISLTEVCLDKASASLYRYIHHNNAL